MLIKDPKDLVYSVGQICLIFDRIWASYFWTHQLFPSLAWRGTFFTPTQSSADLNPCTNPHSLCPLNRKTQQRSGHPCFETVHKEIGNTQRRNRIWWWKYTVESGLISGRKRGVHRSKNNQRWSILVFPREVSTWTNTLKSRTVRIGAEQQVVKWVEEKLSKVQQQKRVLYIKKRRKSLLNAIPTKMRDKGNRNECRSCHYMKD